MQHSSTVVKKWKVDYFRIALFLWLVCIIIVSVRAFLKPYNHSVYPIYSFAVSNWISGQSTYFTEAPREQDVYRYAPGVTVLFVPLHFLGDAVGSVVWRWINVLWFLWASFRWFQCFCNSEKNELRLGVFLLLIMPLSLTSLNNGQVNLLMMSGFLMGLCLIQEGKHFLAGLCLSLAVVLKIYPLFLVVLIMLAFPFRFLVGFLAGGIFFLLIPFFFQYPSFVFSQYTEWIESLTSSDRSNWELEKSYRDLWLVIRYYGLPISQIGYKVVQLITALGVCAVILIGRVQGLSRNKLALLVTGLGPCWLTLFGPSSESSTYVILAPAIAYALIYLKRSVHSFLWIFSSLGVILFLLALGGGVIVGTTKIHAMGFHPLGALLFFIQYLVLAVIWIRVGGVKNNEAKKIYS